MSTSTQTFGSRFGAGNNSRPSSKDGPKKNLWSSMLDNVANGKRLPEKNLLILGMSSLVGRVDGVFAIFVLVAAGDDC